MAITVKQVVEIARDRGCTLVTGVESLGRVVRYVDSMEIPNMEAWMRPDVLYITTGYAYSGTKERLLSLVKSLHEAKAAALAIKSRFIKEYMEDVLQLAKMYQFPIIIMPEKLPFVELNYAVMEALVTDQHNETLKSQEQYNKRVTNKKLFIDFLTGNLTCEDEKNQRTKKLKWPKPPYHIVLFEAEGFLDEIPEERYIKAEQFIYEVLLEEKCMATVLSNNNMFPCILKSGTYKFDQEFFENIQKRIAEKMNCNILVGVSQVGESYLDFCEVYQGAMDALDIARSQEVKQKVVLIEKMEYWRLLKEISHQSVCKNYVSKQLDALIQYDKENESNLVETLESLVNHLGAKNTTATCLYLHRNTLMYRIKKIEHLTGYNLSDPESILELSLALHLKRFME